MKRIYRMFYYLWHIERYTIAARDSRNMTDQRLVALTDQVARQHNDIMTLRTRVDILEVNVLGRADRRYAR